MPHDLVRLADQLDQQADDLRDLPNGVTIGFIAAALRALATPADPTTCPTCGGPAPLSPEASAAFLALLDNPPAPTEALRRAFSRHYIKGASMPRPDISESTVARIAGNLLSGFANTSPEFQSHHYADAVREAVALARAIVAEVRATAPPEPPQ